MTTWSFLVLRHESCHLRLLSDGCHVGVKVGIRVDDGGGDAVEHSGLEPGYARSDEDVCHSHLQQNDHAKCGGGKKMVGLFPATDDAGRRRARGTQSNETLRFFFFTQHKWHATLTVNLNSQDTKHVIIVDVLFCFAEATTTQPTVLLQITTEGKTMPKI